MALQLLTKEVKGTGFSPIEALLVAGAKVVSENALARVAFVGNGTLRSGIIKLVGATVLTSMSRGSTMMSKAGNIFGTALMVDGGEDVIRGLLSLRNSGQSETAQVGGSSANQGVGAGDSI